MNRILVIIVLTFVFTTARAHNPNTCSVVFRPINGVWMAQFTISQEGANVALNQFYKDLDLPSLDPDEYKKLYIHYLKSHTQLLVDNEEVLFSSGGIKLGNHQANINFLLPDFPEEFEDLHLQLPVFEENKEQNTAVTFEDQAKHFRKVLNHQNDFELQFQNTETAFLAATNSNTIAPRMIYYGLGFIAVLSLLILVFKGKIQEAK